MIILEELLIPMPLHRETLFLQNTERILKHMRITRHVIEFS